MKMHALFLMLVCCAVLTGCCECECVQEPSQPQTFKIVVLPSKTKVHLREPIKTVFRVENMTSIPQKIKVMNCSWYDHWQSSNPLVSYMAWNCSKNFAVEETIAPGAAYVRELELIVLAASDLQAFAEAGNDPKWKAVKPVSKGPVQFKYGFTPIGSLTTYWSENVEIEVVP